MPSPGDQWCSAGVPNGGVGPNIVLGLTDMLLLLADAPLAITFLVEQLGLIPLITADFCSVGAVYPGDPVASDATDILDPGKSGAVIDKYVGLVKYYAWPHYCTCTTFVPPYSSQPTPPSWPSDTTTPTSLCSPADLTRQLSAIQSLEQSLYTLVSLIAMRVGAMAYVLGDAHTVTGEGELSVSSIIGVLVDGLTFAPGTGQIEGDPLRIYTDGFIAFGNSSGWESRFTWKHVPQIFLGATPFTSRVGYTCGMATSVRITELIPSPLSP